MRPRATFRLVPVLALAAALLAAGPVTRAAANGAPLVVTLRDAARVPTETVTLGQIATITGRDGARALLAQIVVLPSLSPGATVRLTAPQVRAAIADAGFDARAITVTGPPLIRIDRVVATVAPVAAQAPAPADRAAAVVTPPTVPARSSAATLVQRGATVRIIATVASVRVTTTGVALASGAAGEAIPVRVSSSRREIIAMVVERGVVAVTL